MPRKPDKQYRIRVKTIDGKARDESALNKLKSNQLRMPHLDLVGSNVANEFIICASKDTHIAQVSAKLQVAGLEMIAGGAIELPLAKTSGPPPRQGDASQPRGAAAQGGGAARGGAPLRHSAGPLNGEQSRPGKPYGFVELPKDFTTAPPIWHDGASSKGRISGEIRFEMEALTPLLVGWERGQVDKKESEWSVPSSIFGHELPANKSVLCPLRAPWGKRPVIIPGDSLKGLLRHELGALLGAPMERVAERSYSYRPNALFPLNPERRRLVPRLARVLDNYVETNPQQIRVPTRLELFPASLEYNKKANRLDYRFDQPNGAPYKGGQGAGQRLNSRPRVHTSLTVPRNVQTELVDVPPAARDGYLASVRHLVDLDQGHFSARHPDVPKTVTGATARERILKAAKDEVFQPGDLIWVEWDTMDKCIVSLGWHYYYRWAYTDTVRYRRANKDTVGEDTHRLERQGLFPLDKELEAADGDAPAELSAVRRLFGYTGDNEGCKGIGKAAHAQLMGRVFVNAGLEVVGENESEDQRFLGPAFLKELGMPRPSAVEHYLKQPFHPRSRPSDNASLVTYGDAAGYDEPGELAGRKFYLDRPDAAAADDSETNKGNSRSTLALEVSKQGRRFRFTVRFRDLDSTELAAIMIAFCPEQFKSILGGTFAKGYCSKLGYARPLGWGSVRIEAKQLLFLEQTGETPSLKPAPSLASWVADHHQKTSTQSQWLDIHRCHHPDAADYPRVDGNSYTFHTKLRAEHSRNRRYKKDGAR